MTWTKQKKAATLGEINKIQSPPWVSWQNQNAIFVLNLTFQCTLISQCVSCKEPPATKVELARSQGSQGSGKSRSVNTKRHMVITFGISPRNIFFWTSHAIFRNKTSTNLCSTTLLHGTSRVILLHHISRVDICQYKTPNELNLVPRASLVVPLLKDPRNEGEPSYIS